MKELSGHQRSNASRRSETAPRAATLHSPHQSVVRSILRADASRSHAASPLAVTEDGRTSFSPAVATHPRRAAIEAHEAVHRAQFGAWGFLPRGSVPQLEKEARAGANAMVRGALFLPSLAACEGIRLASPEEEAQEEEKSAGDWIVGVLAGDFEEDPTLGQIAARTILTLIPGIDTLGDIEDLAAALHKLAIQKRYDEFWPWFDLVVTAIGFIPEAGSIAKGVFKAVKKGGKSIDFKALLKVVGASVEKRPDDVLRLVDDLIQRMPHLKREASAWIAGLVDELIEKLSSWWMKGLVIASGIGDKLTRLVESLRVMRKQIGARVADVIEWLRCELRALQKKGSSPTGFLYEARSRVLLGGVNLDKKGRRKMEIVDQILKDGRIASFATGNQETLWSKLTELFADVSPSKWDTTLKRLRLEGHLKGATLPYKEFLERSVLIATRKDAQTLRDVTLHNKLFDAASGKYDFEFGGELMGFWAESLRKRGLSDLEIFEELQRKIEGVL